MESSPQKSPACYGRNSPVLSGGLPSHTGLEKLHFEISFTTRAHQNRLLEGIGSVDSRLMREHFTESLANGPGYLKEGKM